MEEQLLKDLLETAKANNYNWDVIMPKFPELKDVDLQLLKDYTETAIKYDYDYDVINPKFPEFFGKETEVEKKTKIQSLLQKNLNRVQLHLKKWKILHWLQLKQWKHRNRLLQMEKLRVE